MRARTSAVASGLTAAGLELVNDTWFDTLTFDLPRDEADRICQAAEAAGINLRRQGEGLLGMSVNEKTTPFSDNIFAFAGAWFQCRMSAKVI